MIYSYVVVIAKPDDLEKCLNYWGQQGYKLHTQQALNTIKGMKINGQPDVEVSYQLTMEKRERL